MAWGDTQTIPDGQATPVNQVYSREAVGPDTASYLNTTALALGNVERLSLSRQSFPRKIGGVAIPYRQFRFRWEAKDASDAGPTLCNATIQFPETVGNDQTRGRKQVKGFAQIVNTLVGGTQTANQDSTRIGQYM